MLSLCCLIIISHLETTETQEHSSITLFYHAPSLCATRDALKHTARGSAHASEPKSRRKVHDENVHDVELPKDPVIVVGGGELVARELAAREHHPAAETTAAPSPSRSDRGRTWSTKQLLRVIKIDRVDVDRHPCARKQVLIREIRAPRARVGRGG